MFRFRPPASLLATFTTLTFSAACHDATAPAARPATRTLERAAPNQALLPGALGYEATILPIVPAGINDGGVVVGTAAGTAKLWSNGQTATLPRSAAIPGAYEGRAINKQGAVVGNVTGGSGLFWRTPNAEPTRILASTPDDVTQAVTPTAVNGGNVVVGRFDYRDPRNGQTYEHAFRWEWGWVARDITPPGFESAVALDINDDGYIVGYGRPVGGAPRALRWAPFAGNQAQLLSTFAFSSASAINGNGIAVGMVGVATKWSLFNIENVLPTPANSSPDDITTAGRIVGTTEYQGEVFGKRPWTFISGATTPLPVPNAGWTARFDALRVNACGAIVGQQVFLDESVGGVLWTRSRCDVGVLLP